MRLFGPRLQRVFRSEYESGIDDARTLLLGNMFLSRISSQGHFAFRALAAAEPRHRYVRPLHSKPSPGTELSGFLGFAMLRQLELKLDYRDGLVDLEYDTKRVQPSAR